MANFKREYYNRAFLNQSKGSATFETKLEFWHENLGGGYLKISDCNRQVSLELGYETAEEKENVLFKVDTIIAELNAIKEQLLANY